MSLSFVMKKKKYILLPLLALAVASASISLHSCSEVDNCSIEGRPMINCTLYTTEPGSDTAIKDTLESLTVTAVGSDSIILNRASSVSSMSLPLRYTNDTTALVLHYDYDNDPSDCDTLYIFHSNTPYFESLDCGYSVKQAITNVKHTTVQIDSIRIKDVNTNTNGTENLKIYYRYTY
jgi:hypothetical protein